MDSSKWTARNARKRQELAKIGTLEPPFHVSKLTRALMIKLYSKNYIGSYNVKDFITKYQKLAEIYSTNLESCKFLYQHLSSNGLRGERPPELIVSKMTWYLQNFRYRFP